MFAFLLIAAAPSVSCGVIAETDDWTTHDPHGSLEPFERILCRAIAVAAFGREATADVHVYPAEAEALHALETHEVKTIFGVTPTITAAAKGRVVFGPVIFWDSPGFLSHDGSGLNTAASLAGKRVCFIEGTETERVLRAHFPAMLRLTFQEQGEMEDALAGGACQAIVADQSKLAQVKSRVTHVSLHSLDDRLTPDSMSVAVASGDPRWSALVDATIRVLLQAEASGVTMANAATLHADDDPERQRLRGADWASGAALGSPHGWPVGVLSAVGNYGEIYARTIALPRGLNALWSQGGLMAPQSLR